MKNQFLGFIIPLNHIRSKFWIAKGRNMVAPPGTWDLPNYRLDLLLSLKATGLNYADPLYPKTLK